MPTAVAPAGTSRTTTAFEPTLAPSQKAQALAARYHHGASRECLRHLPADHPELAPEKLAQVARLIDRRGLGDKVRLSCPVRRITGWNQEVITLLTDQGEVRARRVGAGLTPDSEVEPHVWILEVGELVTW